MASVIIPLCVLSVPFADKTTNNSHALQSHELHRSIHYIHFSTIPWKTGILKFCDGGISLLSNFSQMKYNWFQVH